MALSESFVGSEMRRRSEINAETDKKISNAERRIAVNLNMINRLQGLSSV